MRRKAIGKPPVAIIFLVELLFSLVIGLCLSLFGAEIAYSAILGGCIAASASFAFALLACRYQGAAEVQKMVINFYQGEVAKLIVAALLFAAVFKWVQPVNVIALFFVFALVLAVHGVVPEWLEHIRKKWRQAAR